MTFRQTKNNLIEELDNGYKIVQYKCQVHVLSPKNKIVSKGYSEIKVYEDKIFFVWLQKMVD